MFIPIPIHHCPSLSLSQPCSLILSVPLRYPGPHYYPEHADGTCPVSNTVPIPQTSPSCVPIPSKSQSQSNPPTLAKPIPYSSSSPYLQPHPDPLLNHTRRFPYSSLSLSPHRFLTSSSTRILQQIRVAGSVLGVRELSDRYPPELQDNDRSNR